MKKHFMKHRISFVVLALAIAVGVSACDSSVRTTNTAANTSSATTASPSPAASMGEMSGMSHDSMMKSSPDAASAPYDLQFLDTMSEHHQAAIDMAKPAENKAQHMELKSLAKNIVADQQKEIAQMKSWRDAWFAGKPVAMNMEMSGMMDSMKGMDMGKLNAATGNDFDLMFIDMMTPHHAGAVTMAQEALTKAQHPEIKKLAQGIIDAQKKEIAQMNDWKKAWTNTQK
ncbi:MAG: DUF305 domain-containing protein [Pyrinomonadaceae bacterium]